MITRQTTRKVLLILCAMVFLTDFCLEAKGDFTTETGGVEIVLPSGWEQLNQPINFFVQKRARHAEQNTALSAGSFVLDMTLEQYVALGLAGMVSGPDATLEKLGKDVGISKEDVEKALTSKIGRQLMDSLKQSSRTIQFELLNVNKGEVDGRMRFDVHSKLVVKESGQVIFSRQFLLAGSSPNEIVQITYASASEEIFSQKDLPASIRIKAKVK